MFVRSPIQTMKKGICVEAKLTRIHLAARAMLAFVFMYHGLVPKILWLSAMEVELASAHGFDASVISPLAGVLEILLGLVLVVWRTSLIPVYAAIALLAALLVDVMILKPSLLTEAFNPVTLNLATMFIAYVVIVTQTHTVPKRAR